MIQLANNHKNQLLSKINYKDLLIILGIWYFIAAINFLLGEFNFNHTPALTGLFHYLFIVAGRFIYLALIIFYFISLYSISFSDLGLTLKNLKSGLLSAIFLISALFLTILVFINVPLSYNLITSKFNPLYQVKTPDMFVDSLLPLIFIFIPNIIIALSEQVILNNIIFELFNLKLNTLLAIILSSLFYPVLFLNFNASHILINFIVALISIYLYLKAEGSIIISSLFISGFYSFYIFYIYGWNFLAF